MNNFRYLVIVTAVAAPFSLLSFTPAHAQAGPAVSQKGQVTANDCVSWVGNAVIQDAGASCGTGGSSGGGVSITAGVGLTASPNPITGTASIALAVPVVISSGGTNCIGLVSVAAASLAGTTLAQCGVAITGTAALGAPALVYLPTAASVAPGQILELTDEVTGTGLSATNYATLTAQAGDNISGISFSSAASFNAAVTGGTWLMQSDGVHQFRVIGQPGVASITAGACVNGNAQTITVSGTVVGNFVMASMPVLPYTLTTGAPCNDYVYYSAAVGTVTLQPPAASAGPTIITNQSTSNLIALAPSGYINASGYTAATLPPSWAAMYESNGVNYSWHWFYAGTYAPVSVAYACNAWITGLTSAPVITPASGCGSVAYTSGGSFTYTPPTWADANTADLIDAIGAGGGGSYCNASGAVGRPGGGGGVSELVAIGLIVNGTTYQFALGTAGAAGVTTSQAGTAGGSTTVLVSAVTYTGSGGVGGASCGLAAAVTLGGGFSNGIGFPGGGGIATIVGGAPLQMSGAAGLGFGPSLVQSGLNSVAIGGQGYGGGAVGGSGSVANAGATGAPAGIYLELRGN